MGTKASFKSWQRRQSTKVYSLMKTGTIRSSIGKQRLLHYNVLLMFVVPDGQHMLRKWKIV